MIRVETGHYIKGMHNLLNAHFDLRNFEKFEIRSSNLKQFAQTTGYRIHDNFRIQTLFISTRPRSTSILCGELSKKGWSWYPDIEEKLEEYALFVDRHRIMVFNYKIATLYFGSGIMTPCIDYLQKIINGPVDLRYDLQCYARLLHLMAHYELGNYEYHGIADQIGISVYGENAKPDRGGRRYVPFPS